MTERQAQKAAKAYTARTGKNAFVYDDKQERGGCDWCTDEDYRHGAAQWVRESAVFWSTFDGYY